MTGHVPKRPPLFTEHFLSSRLPAVAGSVRADADDAYETIKAIHDRERASLDVANEAQTEELFVKPALEALGWAYHVQAGFRIGRHRQPDYVLYANDTERRTASALTGLDRYATSLAICEAKRWGRPLDGKSTQRDERGDPHLQTVTYMALTRSRWSMLTNGGTWRLYALESDLESGESHTVDLLDIIERDDRVAFARFYVLFARQSYERPAAGEAPIELWLRDAREHATSVGKQLREQVLEAVPLLAAGLLEGEAHTREALDEAYDGALTVLFRLLFCLYAEARELLPAASPHYRGVSLAETQDAVAHKIDGGGIFAAGSDSLYGRAKGLFRMIDRGDIALGITEYNGGLFKRDRYPYLQEPRTISDRYFAPALDKLSRLDRRRLDYLGLGVRHLGGIYENLLAYRLVSDDDGNIGIEPSDERHGTGSYFTPEVIVDRIVERTLEPIVDRVLASAQEDGLDHDATLERLLSINVLDPAMGSAHFLVGTTLYLARAIHEALSDWDDVPDEPSLRRLVAERCCYGVDLNPLAVELARLSLWLATARTGEPLTFLPNLQTGNSLVGPRLAELRRAHATSPKRIAEAVGRLFVLADEIEHVPSDQAEQVRHKYELDAQRAATREDLEATLLEGEYPDVPFVWDLAFPDIYLDAKGEERDGGGFDAVVGNPPYVEIQSMDRATASYLRGEYDTAHDKFDLYVPFIERSLALLSSAGRLGFIVPSRFQKLDYGSKLRGQLAASGAAHEIIDFGHHQVFEEATNYTSVLVADRSNEVGSILHYRRVEPGSEGWEAATAGFDNVPPVDYDVTQFASDPWILVPPFEHEILAQMLDGAETLGEVAERVFQGAITSADTVFLLRVLERRGGVARCWSSELDSEVELETDLLHHIVSGADVERYAFKPIETMVLFPYVVAGDRPTLISWSDLEAATPKTAEYLERCEAVLRGRKSIVANDENWWSFARTRDAATIDEPKLGVAQTVRRLEVGVDRAGGTFFHNARVNGIVPRAGGASLDLLNALLGSRLLDWAFRRYSVELQNDHWAANKQFITPLPIRATGKQVEPLERLGRQLHDGWREVYEERHGFLIHINTLLGHDVRALPGSRTWLDYENHSVAELLRLLRAVPRRRAAFAMSVTGRDFAEALATAHRDSCDKLAASRAELAKLESEADDLVYALYGLSDEQRAYVDAEYA
jgi:hypothetical protein